jgi:hypothetical protein
MSEVGALRRSLSEAGIIYLDASVLALHLVGDPMYLPLTRLALGGIRDGELSGLTSALSVYQLLVEPYRSGAEGSAERIERLLSGLPGLEIVPVSPSLAAQAAQVKAQIGGSLTRAVQIATALASEAELYVTPRSALRRIAGLGVLQLDAYRAPGSDG